jgi:hypothetical protein
MTLQKPYILNQIDTINTQLAESQNKVLYKDVAGYDNIIINNLGFTFMLSNNYTVQQMKDRIDLLVSETKLTNIALGITMNSTTLTSSDISHGTSNPTILNEIIPYIQGKGLTISCVRNMAYTQTTSVATYLANTKTLLLEVANAIKTYGITKLFIANEQGNITPSNYTEWVDIINSLKALGITTGVTTAAFGQTVCFYDAIDIIGFNFYQGLTGMTSSNTNEEILNSFKTTFLGGFTQLCDIKAKYNKPIVITEFGCGNRALSMQQPTQTTGTGVIDLIAQKKYLEVACSYFGQLTYNG